ncbi:MAG: hypothetical protein LBC77_07570 [Spirochaetaceae bacterium]|jgi:hypothetical protein|nr:hypothetical protein [Spirochaetaceae bacterium]
MRKCFIILSAAGIIAFAAILVPPVFEKIISVIVENSYSWHLDQRGFVKSELLHAAVGGILFSVLLLAACFNFLQRSIQTLCKIITRNYNKLYWPLICLPFVIRIAVIMIFGVNTPIGEDWMSVNTIMPQILESTITWGGFLKFVQNSIYWSPVPFISVSVLGLLTSLNVKLILVIASFVWLIPYLCFVFYIRKRTNSADAESKTKALLITIVLGIIFNNLAQRDQILKMTASIFGAFSLGFTVLAFYLFELAFNQNGRRQIIIMVFFVFSVIISVFSWIPGFIIIPAILCTLILIVFNKEGRAAKYIIFCLFTAALVFAMNYYCHTLTGGTRLFNSYKNPAISLITFIVQTGNVTGCAFIAPFAGIIFLISSAALVLWLVKIKRVKQNLFPIFLIAEGWGFGIGTMIDRSNGSLLSMLATHRAVGGIFIVCGLMLIIWREFLSASEPKASRIAARFMIKPLFCTVAAFSILSNFLVIPAVNFKKEYTYFREMILNYKNLPRSRFEEIPENIFYFGNLDMLETLEKNAWLGFPKN